VPVAVAVDVAVDVDVDVAVGDVVVGVGVGVRVGVGDADVRVGVGDVVMVWVGAVVACVAVDTMTGWVVVPVCAEDALAVGCLRGVAVADADAGALVGLVADETCAAGDWAGVVVCPCEPRAKAAPAPPRTSTPRTPASTSDQRRGGPPVPDGASPIGSSGEPSARVGPASVA
jgi:hypothetical protein